MKGNWLESEAMPKEECALRAQMEEALANASVELKQKVEDLQEEVKNTHELKHEAESGRAIAEEMGRGVGGEQAVPITPRPNRHNGSVKARPRAVKRPGCCKADTLHADGLVVRVVQRAF